MSVIAYPSKHFRYAETLSVRTRGLALTDELRRVIRGCVAAATGRFQEQVRRVFVLVEDSNGPKGGPAMHCRMEVTLKRGGRITATAAATDEYVAIGRAADRLRVRLVRSVEKRRHRRRETPSPLLEA